MKLKKVKVLHGGKLPVRFEIILSKQALKYYQKVSKNTARRIDRAFLLLEKDPTTGGDIKILTAKRKRYRLRIGDLRVVYQIDLKLSKIQVSAILPRGDVYKKLS